MIRKHLSSLTVSVVLILVFCHPLLAAKLYKWVDESGEVHYSDKIPPHAITGSHSTLSKAGVTTGRHGAAKTPEEIAREEELKKLREEQQRLLQEQQARDQVLLKTFRSDDDIILARDGKLATYNAQIRIVYENIERLKKRMLMQQKRAAMIERQGAKMDPKTKQGIENTRQEIKSNYASILRQEKDKQLIKDKYAADLKRFRELKKLQLSAAEDASLKGTKEIRNPLIDTAIPCPDEALCNVMWEKARSFGTKHAMTPIYVDSDKIFLTKPPLEDNKVSLTISRLRTSKEADEIIFLDIQCSNQPTHYSWCNSDLAKSIRLEFLQEMGQ